MFCFLEVCGVCHWSSLMKGAFKTEWQWSYIINYKCYSAKVFSKNAWFICICGFVFCRRKTSSHAVFSMSFFFFISLIEIFIWRYLLVLALKLKGWIGPLQSYSRFSFVEVGASPSPHGSDGLLGSNIQGFAFFRRKRGFSVVGGWGL